MNAEWMGTLRRVDLGAGQWVLETGQGIVPLYGPIPAEFVGLRVRVAGRRVEVFGFGLSGNGAAIEVERVERAA